MNKISKIKVGFDPRNGNLLIRTNPNEIHIQEWDHKTKSVVFIPITWKDNFSFTATLKVVDWTDSKTSVYLTVEDVATKQQYYMKLRDFMDVATLQRIDKGEMTGEWTFTRSGGHTGICPYIP